MNIDIETNIVSNELKISLNDFFPESTEEEYLTIKKIDKVDEIKYNLYIKKVRKNKLIGEGKKNYDELVDELIDKDEYSKENEDVIKALADIGELTCKTFIDLSVIPNEKHTFFYEKNGKKIYHHLNYETLKAISNQVNPRMIDYIFGICKEWNSAFFG
jgi:hypothetical protein